MQKESCSHNDIIHLENNMFYCIIANCIVDRLVDAVADKKIKQLSMNIWVYLKSVTHTSSKDYSLTISAKHLADKFKLSKRTIQYHLKELEENGYINIIRSKKSRLENNVNIIQVRFPVSEIIECKKYKKRSKNDKKLSTGYSEKICTRVVKNTAPYYTNNNTNINNNRDSDINTAREELSKSVSVNFVDDLDYIDEMMDGEKPSLPHHDHNHECLIEDFEHDDDECPFDEDIAMLEKQIIDMQNKEKIAKEQYKSDKRDTSSFQTWQNIEAFIETAKIELESMQCKRDKFLTYKNANKSDLANVEESQPDKQNTHLKESDKNTKQNTDYCLPTPIKLSDKQIKMIASKVNILHKQGFVSDPAGLTKMIIYQVSRNRVGKTVEHGINICIKLVRENRYRTPAGYVDPYLCKRDFDVMRHNVIKNKVSSSFNNLF